MKIKDQVCTRDQAKKLVEMGIFLDTVFAWHHGAKYPLQINYGMSKFSIENGIMTPAPNVAELGVLLIEFGFSLTRDNITYEEPNAPPIIGWDLVDYHKQFLTHVIKDNEAQARTEALIWLIENGYIELEKLKL